MTDKLTVTHKHVDHICNVMERIALASYERAPDGHYDVRMPYPSMDTTTSLAELFHTHSRGYRLIDKTFTDMLKNAGFAAYSTLGYGTNTWVYVAHHENGHDYAARLSLKPRERRALTPLVLQPYADHRQQGLVADVTPLIQILMQQDSSVPIAQENLPLNETEEFILDTVMRKFMTAASCTSTEAMPCKDMGILPDGTPIQPDPGQIVYAPGAVPEQAIPAFSTFKSPVARRQLEWLGPRGFKQDEFFINPFRRTPQYRGFTIPSHSII